MIRKVNEVDPMRCPKCGGEMRVVAFLTEPAVVGRIIDHLKLTFATEKPPPEVVYQELLWERPILQPGIFPIPRPNMFLDRCLAHGERCVRKIVPPRRSPETTCPVRPEFIFSRPAPLLLPRKVAWDVLN
jgi:hypothetical protein